VTSHCDEHDEVLICPTCEDYSPVSFSCTKELIQAAKEVVKRREKGDLAEAVRNLDSAVKELEDDEDFREVSP